MAVRTVLLSCQKFSHIFVCLLYSNYVLSNNHIIILQLALNFISGPQFIRFLFVHLIDKYFVIMGHKIYRWFPFCWEWKKPLWTQFECSDAQMKCVLRKQSRHFHDQFAMVRKFFFAVKFMKIDTMTQKNCDRSKKKVQNGGHNEST